MANILRSPNACRKLFAMRIDAVEDAVCDGAGHPAAYPAYSPAALCTQALDTTNAHTTTTTTTSINTPTQTHTQTTKHDQTTTHNANSTTTKWDKILDEFSDVFEPPSTPYPRAIQHRIELLDPNRPIPNHKQYRLSQTELDEAKKQIDDLLAKGWIQPSYSQYNHPILFVPKKGGELRMCIDFRALNSNTIIDRYPIPRIDDILDRLGGSTVYSKIDLTQAYH